MSRYSAFISYSHADTPVAAWLHRALETYRVPKALVGSATPLGPAPRRLKPIFRDRDELAVSGDLGAELRAALGEADFQIVLCSPRAAQSKWVGEEILAYKRLHGEKRTFALIVEGEPYSADRECFPAALRFTLGADGQLSDIPAEPIAADIRPGKDGKRLALMKLLAGLTGLKLDSLVRRDEARRRRRLLWIAGGALGVAAVTLVLAVYALAQRDEARLQRVEAERQRDLADSSLDFLINTFSIANPATENPRTITAITILDRVSKRAVGAELKARPEVRARLLGATGDIYANLGLDKEAEHDLQAALRLAPARGGARAAVLVKLAGIALKRHDLPSARALGEAASHIFNPDDPLAADLSARLASVQGLTAYYGSDYKSAADRFHAAVILYTNLPDDHSRELAGAFMNEGNALVRIKRFQDADAAFARAEQIDRKSLGPDHVRTATAMQNRALGAFEAGRFAQAEAMLARALTIYRRVLDPDHQTTADALLLEGRIRHARADFPGASAAFDQAIAMYTRLYGQQNAAVGDAAFYAAEARSDAGQPREALAYVQVAQKAYDRSFGLVDPEQVELANMRAQVLRAAGRIEDARAACDHGIDVQARLNPRDPELPSARAHCAALLADPSRGSLNFRDRR